MNAKKIMGAVLVALLAAALFIGAGAAAVGSGAGETVFVYEAFSGSPYSGTWVNGANTVTFEAVTVNDATGYVAIVGTDIVEGTYTQTNGANTKTIVVKYPTAVINGIATVGTTGVKYPFIGGNLYADDTVKITSATGGNVAAAGYLITIDGVEEKYAEGSQDAAVNGLVLGTYNIQAYFNAALFADGTPANYLNGAVYTFTVVDDDDVTVSADVDTILPGGNVKLTIVAKPGTVFTLGQDTKFTIADKQQNVNEADTQITVPNTGKVTVVVTANNGATGEQTIELVYAVAGETKTADVDVTIQKGTISAAAGAASYFVGDKITITGTSTAGDVDEFILKGTNFGPVDITDKASSDKDADAKAFKFEIPTKDITFNNKKLDVGTYTITLNTSAGVKATVPVVLKQPFITIINAPEVIVKGADDADFVIGAEATTAIRYYIFGTNYFNASGVVNGPKADTTNQFEFTLPVEETKVMDPGQYFMVIQHPMYDGAFNILAFDEAFYLNTSGNAVKGTGFLFNVDVRQTANAAQALCDALDSQNIDDMYVKYSFFVVGEDESFVINPIPAEVAKGTTLVISGVDTANAEEAVLVEMISTAFAAVPKDTVGSAAFVAVTTTVAEDGTWEVTLDTSELNIDEYALTVKIAEDVKKNVNIKVVEAADEPVTPPTDDPGQDEPGQDEPVAPETPGFGALAALAGLGAVAVLLLRRE